MYIAALRIADDFGCDAIGIQYQQGLKDLAPASDLAEGLLNNVDRPPVRPRGNGRVLYEGRALPHFNEVDECAGLDALVDQPGVDARWATIRRPRCTTCAMASASVNGAAISSGCWRFRARCRRRTWSADTPGGERAPASHVFPPGRRQLQGRQQAGRNRVEPRLRRRQPSEGGSGPRPGHRAAARGDRAPLAHHHAAVAHDARGARWRFARPVHGAAQSQSHPGGLCADAQAAGLALAAKAAMFREMGIEVAICGCGHGL